MRGMTVYSPQNGVAVSVQTNSASAHAQLGVKTVMATIAANPPAAEPAARR